MIVRINQLELAAAEPEAGWASRGVLGPIVFDWPADARVYEVLILNHDEQKRPLPESFRQQQMRQLIPRAVAALREPGEEIVVRLDGPLSDRELVAAFRHLTDPAGQGRFAVSEVEKLDPRPQEVFGSIRLQPSLQGLLTLCTDAELGLERSVRLRVVSVPEPLVNTLLDVTATDDERWDEILQQAGFVLGTVRGLRSLQVTTRRFDAPTMKGRLVRQLTAPAPAAVAPVAGRAG